MKKFLLALSLLACTTFFVGCSRNTPSKAVDKAAKMFIAGDIDGYFGTYDITEQEKYELSTFWNDFGNSFFESKGGVASYTILSETMGLGNTSATVEVEMTFGNGETDRRTFHMVKKDKEWKQKLN